MNIAISACPARGFVTNVVAFSRLSAIVTYYLCQKCGHIWAVHKTDPTVIDHFMPLRKEAE